MDQTQFTNRTIAVVGNSRLLLDSGCGPRIDAHDLVIRFNLAWPGRAERPEGTGQRTTHMSVGGRMFKTPEAAERFACIRARHPAVSFFSAEGRPGNFDGVTAPVPLLPPGAFTGWQAEMQTAFEPSSGALLLWFLLNHCRARRIGIFGFDGLRTPIWYKTQPVLHAACHSSEVEGRYLDKIDRAHDHVTVEQLAAPQHHNPE